MSAYKIGDVVRLKSGSPKMTVVDVEENRIQTSWFSEKKAESLWFPLAALEMDHSKNAD